MFGQPLAEHTIQRYRLVQGFASDGRVHFWLGMLQGQSNALSNPVEAALILTGTQRGMAYMLLSTLTFMTMNGITRHLANDLHPFEMSFFRSLFGLAFFIPLLVGQGWAPLRTQRLGAQLYRGALNGASMLLYFLALKYASLVKVTALFFSTPLFGALMAVLVLRETIRGRRIAALAIGFVGMLVIIRPDRDILDFGAALVLSSAVISGYAVVLIKQLSRTEAATTITIYTGLVTMPMSLIAALPFWQTPTGEQLAWMVAMGALGSIGQYAMVKAFSEAEVTAVLPLDFTKLIWSAAIGYLAFGEVPEIWTWIGGAMICASAVYIAHRERLTQRHLQRSLPILPPT